MSKIKVYIASPYTIGDKETNVRRQIDAWKQLKDLGFCPYAPLLNHYIDLVHKYPEQVWYDYDLEWLEACDVVLRLDGESKGADMEELFAQSNLIPVYHSIDELVKNAKPEW